MSASSADPNTIQVDITYVDNRNGVVHMETNIWDIDENEEFIGIALVTTTPIDHKKTKKLKCKK